MTLVAATVILSTVMGVGFYLLWRRGERLVVMLTRHWRSNRAGTSAVETGATI